METLVFSNMQKLKNTPAKIAFLVPTEIGLMWIPAFEVDKTANIRGIAVDKEGVIYQDYSELSSLLLHALQIHSKPLSLKEITVSGANYVGIFEGVVDGTDRTVKCYSTLPVNPISHDPQLIARLADFFAHLLK